MSSTSPSMYELRACGSPTGAERFTTFELAVDRGTDLATCWKVRLFYADTPGAPYYLLADCRPATTGPPTLAGPKR